MKRIQIKTWFLGSVILITSAFAQGVHAQKMMPKTMKSAKQEIQFSSGKWKEILALAKKTNTAIFVDAYATWCGPCKLLKSQTFKEKGVAEFFNKNFISVSLDMEKGEGPALAHTWGVTGYPTLMFFRPDGTIVMKQLGFVEAPELLDMGKQAVAKK